jgi:hypothetical protein
MALGIVLGALIQSVSIFVTAIGGGLLGALAGTLIGDRLSKKPHKKNRSHPRRTVDKQTIR